MQLATQVMEFVPSSYLKSSGRAAYMETHSKLVSMQVARPPDYSGNVDTTRWNPPIPLESGGRVACVEN